MLWYSTSYLGGDEHQAINGVSVHGRSFWKTDWTIYHDLPLADSHTMIRIISRSVPGLATDSPHSIWGHRWITCLLYGGPLSGLCFLNWQLICKFGVVERNLLLISCLYSCLCMLPKFWLLFFINGFLFWNNLFILITLYSHRCSIDSFLLWKTLNTDLMPSQLLWEILR